MNQEETRDLSFGDLLDRLLDDLKEKSYTQMTLANYRRTLRQIELFMVERGTDVYTPEIGLQYFEAYIAEKELGTSWKKAMFTAIRRLNDVYSGNEYRVQQQQEISLLPDTFEHVLSSYATECAQNGNKDNTIQAKKRFVRSFLRGCIVFGCPNISSLEASYITRACLRIKNKDALPVVRAFLRFLSINGITEGDLSALVPRSKRPTTIPATYSEEEIHRFEVAIDRSNAIGKRDYAMLLLATRLGMRSGDIAKLSLDELDFYNDKICLIQQKTGDKLHLPMLPEVKLALTDYISNARPRVESQTVFLRHYAPYQGITTSVLRFVTTKYLGLANIDVSGRKHGPHTFRSSLASSMVNDYVPYEAVRSILGHSSPNVIKHYAKIDIEKLRECAIEVPEPAGSFRVLLEGGQL